MSETLKKNLPKWPVSKDFGRLVAKVSNIQANSLKSASDEELVAAYQKGDTNAFQTLLARHERPLFNFLYKYLGNTEASEEAFQEVFLRVVKHIGDYKPTAKFTTWVYTIARNYCIDHSRKQKFRRHLSLDTPSYDDAEPLMSKVAGQDIGAEEITSAKGMEELLYRVLDDLKPEQREVFILRENQGLAFDQIAKITKTSTNTVKSRMRYALQAIQKKLAEAGIDRETFQKNASSF